MELILIAQGKSRANCTKKNNERNSEWQVDLVCQIGDQFESYPQALCTVQSATKRTFSHMRHTEKMKKKKNSYDVIDS